MSASHPQNVLDAAVARGLPGVTAAIATRSGVVWKGAAGVADIKSGGRMHPDMLLGIGSITKTFVAVVILQLVEEGRLSLNDTAARILGDAVKGVANADEAAITHLLNHFGGVPSWEDDPVWIREGRGAALEVSHIWGKAQTLPYIKGHAPICTPGEKFSYSNTNYTLLGLIIEKITGRDVVSEVHCRILAPLGLQSIYLEGFEPVPEQQLPRRYHWATDTFRAVAGVNAAFPEVRSGMVDASASNLSVEWAAGGMVATAQDLALYGVALRDGRLLNPDSMALMTTWLPIGEGLYMGHNVFRKEYPGGLAAIGHDGGVLGFTASLYWIEGADAVVAAMTNVGSMHAGETLSGRPARDPAFIEAALRITGSTLSSGRSSEA
jgi:D-alanyl-D-alanine carboxypeptidase